MVARTRRFFFAAFIATALGSLIACGYEYTSTPDASDAGNPDASNATGDGSVSDSSNATNDGSIVDAGRDAGFCAHTPAIFCADFDESTAVDGAGFTTTGASTNMVLDIADAMSASPPSSLFATFSVSAGEPAKGGVSSTLNVPNISGSGMTLSMSINVPTLPTGAPVNVIAYATGQTVVAGTIAGEGSNIAAIGWSLTTPTLTLTGGSGFTVGVFHQVVLQIQAGQLTCLVDGAMSFSAPLDNPTDAIGVELGLDYSRDASVATTSGIYIDNVVLTSP